MGTVDKKNEAARMEPAEWYENCLWQPKLMYAISNVQQSSVAIFLAVYYQQTAGFSKVQIGLLQTLPCVCAMVSPPIWGAVADYIHNQRLVHNFCIISGGLLMFSIQYFYWSYHWTLAVLVLANFQSMPAGSLMDHAVLDMIEKVGGEYGKQRLFGAVGWGTGAYITGLAVAAAGISWAFNISLIFMFASLLVLRTIPPVKDGHHDNTHSVVEEGGKPARKPSFADNMRRICEKKDVIMLLLVVCFMGLMYGVLSSFLALNLFNLSGGNAQIVGIAIMCETISELPAFFFSHAIIKKLGTVKVLLVSITAYALRITYYAVMTNAWSAIPFEFLHGCTFGLAWAACTQYIYAAAPKGCEGTVMGLLNATQNGLARAVGTMVGGYFYQHYGARVMWAVTDLGVPLALLFLAAFAYLKSENDEIVSGHDVEAEESEMFSPHHHSKAINSSAPSYDEIE